MPGRACLAIDLGTTSCKAVVLSESLAPLGWGEARLTTNCPSPRACEQDPEEWWGAIVRASGEALSKSGGSPIEVVSLSSQREGAVLLDEEGKPVRPAIVWMDRRASAEAKEMVSDFGEEWLSRVVGLVPSPGFTAPILRWLKREEPEALSKAMHVTQPKGYLILRLTGRRAIDLDLGPRFGLFDLQNRSYREELLEWAGVCESLLPELVEPTEVVGGLAEEAARSLGLKAGTPVVAGMGDRQCEVLGLGLLPGRVVMVATGTATNVSTLTEAIPLSLHPRVAKSPHLRGLFQLEAGIWASGAVLMWLFEQFGPGARGREEVARWLSEEFERGEHAGSLVVLPFFAGASAPHWEPEMSAAILGLGLGHTRADLVRAVVESLAVEIAENVSLYKGLMPGIERVVHCGGGAMIEPFNKSICDACGLEVEIPRHLDSAALGAACLGLSLMLERDPFDLAREANPRWRRLRPSPEGIERLKARREAQRRAHKALRNLLRGLGR